LLRSLADSPVALATQGASVNVTRVLVFCISAFLVGIAGALFASASGSIGGVGFNYFNSLLWLAVLAISGRAVLPGAFIAAALLVIPPAYNHNPHFIDYQPIAFGALSIGAAMFMGRSLGALSWLRGLGERGQSRGTEPRSPVADRTALALAARLTAS
jgi:ABC-type branched-subunit amino acid transport system permease subunit